MAQKIWRYTLTNQEQKFWNMEEMQGWRQALEACVEDEARDQGSKKYLIYDKAENLLVKGDVRKLPEPQLAV